MAKSRTVTRSAMAVKSASRLRKQLEAEPMGRPALASTARCVTARTPSVPSRSIAASSSCSLRTAILEHYTCSISPARHGLRYGIRSGGLAGWAKGAEV